MAERLVKWFFFSIGLTILTIILSLMLHGTFSLEIRFSDYTSELLFMSVTLATTAIGDVVELIRKGVHGIHITIILVSLISISLICIFVYEMPIIANALELSINNTLINVFTIVGCLSSLGLGIACQVFLERIEGSSP